MCSLSPLSFSDILPDMESALLCRWNYTKKAWWNTNSKKQSQNSNYVLCLAKRCALRSRKSQLYRQTFKSSYPRSILRCQISEEVFSFYVWSDSFTPCSPTPNGEQEKTLAQKYFPGGWNINSHAQVVGGCADWRWLVHRPWLFKRWIALYTG